MIETIIAFFAGAFVMLMLMACAAIAGQEPKYKSECCNAEAYESYQRYHDDTCFVCTKCGNTCKIK